MRMLKEITGSVFVWGELWVWGAAVGFRTLLIYQATPGKEASASVRWPDASPVPRRQGRATLIMLAHPRCPCSRASVGELAWIMARVHGQVDAHVFFVKPAGLPSDWEKSDLWRSAASIPGVAVHRDEAAAGAGLFGAETSGQTFVYDASGRLLFSGGITGGRGHAGANAGREAVLALLTGTGEVRNDSPAFGCALVAGRTEKRGWWEQWKL